MVSKHTSDDHANGVEEEGENYDLKICCGFVLYSTHVKTLLLVA